MSKIEDGTGVFLVCTIREKMVYPAEKYGLLLGPLQALPIGWVPSSLALNQPLHEYPSEDLDRYLFSDEIQLVMAVNRHIKEHGDKHRDHLALYRSDGTLICGGPTSWKNVLAFEEAS